MSIVYSHPIRQAWRRMSGLLFHPFDLGRWFVLGFTAFLAGLVESGGNSSSGWRWQEHVNWNAPVDEWPHRAYESAHHALADFWSVGFLLVLLFLALVVGLVVTWLGSRGQFVFLDNLVHRRTEVTGPLVPVRPLGRQPLPLAGGLRPGGAGGDGAPGRLVPAGHRHPGRVRGARPGLLRRVRAPGHRQLRGGDAPGLHRLLPAAPGGAHHVPAGPGLQRGLVGVPGRVPGAALALRGLRPAAAGPSTSPPRR